MKTAIVTGANGFVGASLCRELSSQGVRVSAVIRENASNILSVDDENIRIVSCKNGGISTLTEQTESASFDVFYHVAWDGVSGDKRADYETQLRNVELSMDAVHAARKLGCKRFVGIGSLAEEDVKAFSFMDGARPRSVSLYGVAKLTANLMTKAECAKVDIEHIWARLGNLYGSGDHSNNFVNSAIKSIRDGNAKFTDGEQLYDFVNIQDAVGALCRLGVKGKPYYAYYIGSGKPLKLKEYIRIIHKEVAPENPIAIGAIPFQGVSLSEEVYDCSKLYRDTGFKAKIDFQSGIRAFLREGNNA